MEKKEEYTKFIITTTGMQNVVEEAVEISKTSRHEFHHSTTISDIVVMTKLNISFEVI